MSLAGSLISNFGLQVQKIAFNRQEERIRVAKEQGMEAVRKHMFCMPIWVLGLSAMVCGALLDFGSLSFAAQSLLAPLAASTLVINIIQVSLAPLGAILSTPFCCPTLRLSWRAVTHAHDGGRAGGAGA